MKELAPLAVGVPLLVAALLIVVHPLLKQLGTDVIAILAALATAGMCVALLVHVGHGLEVYWFGGWRTTSGVAVGIDFAVGPIGAGLASFLSILMVLALVYSIRFVGVAQPYYQVMMLTFMAGMVGFCLSGDLFNMFVMFEVMSVSAVALVGYKIEQRAALEGALNFAVINTIGAFLFLLGIGLLYGHTGALNLAQIGRALHGSGDDRVVVVAFTLITGALLIKAAVVPFHFWLADAYSVALTPVCLLLTGVMSEMGIYGLARIYFTAFEPAFAGHAGTLRAIFIGAGLLTAAWGAAMALSEDHLKRLLAFITVAFVGMYLVSLGLLSEHGVSAAGVFIVGDGFTKALLFGCVGIVQHRLGRVSQRRLHGCARHLRSTALLFGAGALILSGLPPFGSFLGKSMVDDAAIEQGYRYLPALLMIIEALCAAAVMRAGARVFLGWGDVEEETEDRSDEETEPESGQGRDHTPAFMTVAVVGLLAGAVGTGVWFGFADLAENAAHRFTDVSGYAALVYGGHAPLGTVSSSAPQWYDYIYGTGATALALAITALDLWGGRMAAAWRGVQNGAGAVMAPIRALHTGRIGDYAAALTLGVGILGGLVALTLR